MEELAPSVPSALLLAKEANFPHLPRPPVPMPAPDDPLLADPSLLTPPCPDPLPQAPPRSAQGAGRGC